MLGDLKKLNKLDPGMTVAQVCKILGEPSQKELKAGRTVLKYSLHQWFQGWKPVYLVFGENQLLEEWHVSEEEFMERQKLWLEALKTVDKDIIK
jgi:SmpA / OmlA family